VNKSEQQLMKSMQDEITLLEDEKSVLAEELIESQSGEAELKRQRSHLSTRNSDLEKEMKSRCHQLFLINEEIKSSQKEDIINRIFGDVGQDSLTKQVMNLINPIIEEIKTRIVYTFLSQEIELSYKENTFYFYGLLDTTGLSEDEYAWENTVDYELKPALLEWIDCNEPETMIKWLRDFANEVEAG